MFFHTNGGGDELRTSVYPSNLVPNGAKLRQRAFRKICKFRFFDAEKKKSENNSDLFFGFSLFSEDSRGARLFLTSKSSSSRFFAFDGQIFWSLRRLGFIFGVFSVRTSTCGEIYGDGRTDDGRTTDGRRTDDRRKKRGQGTAAVAARHG